MAPELGAFYIMDRAYLDFARLHTVHLNGAHFVLRSRKNTKLRRLSSRKVDRSTGVICDQVVRPDGVTTRRTIPTRCAASGSLTGSATRLWCFSPMTSFLIL